MGKGRRLSKEEVLDRLKTVEEMVDGKIRSLKEEVKASQDAHALELELRKRLEKEKEGLAQEVDIAKQGLEDADKRYQAITEEADKLRKEREVLQRQFRGLEGLRDTLYSLAGEIVDDAVHELESKWATKITDQVYELVKNRMAEGVEPLKALDLSEVKEFIRSELQRQDVVVDSTASDVKVELKREPAVFKEDSVEGQIALLILDKYFDKGRRVNHVTKELLRVWHKVDWHKVDEVLVKLSLPPFKLLVKEETEAGGAVYLKDTGKRAGTIGEVKA